jgi:mxaJ protein
VAIVWGPIAGYFARSAPAPLLIQALPERDSLSDFPFQYNIGMGVRRRDRALRDSLQTVLDRKGLEIQGILKQYGVPVFPVKAGDGKDDDDGPAAPPTAPASVDSARATTR